MTEHKIHEDMARILNNAGWTCSGGAHEPGNYDICDDCRETCLDVADIVIRARPAMLAHAWDHGFVDAVASIIVYQTNDRSGLLPNPYREQEEA